ncbi:MAG: efflux RND transporter permease subunit [Elusimicrobia bacterium]|nr:efflux RND transporter permease subunit [Elusimicrobiota bacterium]
MKIVEVCVKRPVFTTMIMCALAVMGALSYLRLGVDLFPNVDFPFVVVNTTLAGASPEEVETSITKPLEEAINTVSGIEELNSYSYEGLSFIFIKFDMDKNVDVAAQDVRDKVSGVQKDLPDGTDPPVISKFEPSALPVVNIAVSGNRDLVDLTELTRKQIKENLETISGVGSASLVGGRKREIHIIVDPLKLTALGLSIKDVKDALIEQNIEVPGGNVEHKDKVFVLRTLGRIDKAEDFNNIVLDTRNGAQLKISDIGRAEDTGEHMETYAYFNGKPCVSLILKKQSGANTLELVDRIKVRLKELQPILPPDIRMNIMSDQSTFIKASVGAVKEHLVLGAVLAAVMVLLFMGDFRSTLISATAIPISVIGTFTVMKMADFTINNITLLGLTVAVGLVIDDAIVVLENIYRHMDEFRKSAVQAALDGTDEIGLAVMATTLSLLVIFLPMAYMDGIVGRFLKSYGLTIAFAIAVSLFVAFTLTPMLCSRFLHIKHGETSKLAGFSDRINDKLAGYYMVALRWAMAHRKFMVGLSIAIMLTSLPLLKFIGKDFMPKDDTSQFAVFVKAPEGTSVQRTREICSQLTDEMKRLPYVENMLINVGQTDDATTPNEGNIIVQLTDIEKRDIPMNTIMIAVRKMFSKYSDLKFTVVTVGGFGASKEAEMEFIVTGPDLNKLQEYSGKILAALKKEKGMVDLDTSFSFAKPEYRVVINRSRAHDLNVKVKDIATSMRTLVSGTEDITKYKEGDELYEVRIRAEERYRDRPEALAALMIPTENNKVVRLDSVAEIVKGFGPTRIDRYNRQRQITVSANMEGMDLGTALKKAQSAFDALKAPPTYSGQSQGRASELGKMLKSFVMAFTLAFLFIYMVLASQFESFMLPLSIMICLPLTIPFALISLFMAQQSLTLFSILGIFMLVGVVKKNAILQVDYTNTLRARGLERYQAIMEANKTRLRPILMTTLTLVASMIPTALDKGAGSAGRSTMAWVIIGGQLLSLVITLLMTPVTYSLLDDLQNWLRMKIRVNAGERHSP